MQGILKPIGEAPQQDAATNPETESFHERLMKRFLPHEFVRVINIDNEPYRWQSMPQSKEHVEQPDSATQHIYRDPADIMELPAGESAIIEGWRAYLFIEGLYKKMIQKRAEGIKLLTNVALQENYAGKIFLGVEDPFAPSASAPNTQDVANDVDKELGITDEPVRRGRPPKTA